MSTFYVSNSCVWIMVTGGYREYKGSINPDLPVTGCDVTVILELSMFIITHIVILCTLNTVTNLINNNIKFITTMCDFTNTTNIWCV